MSELKQFKLPDVGEGLTEADIVKWHVQPGDRVTINQVVVEIETAKAVVELPSPFEGVVAGLLAAEGTTVDVGTPILSVSTGAGGEQPASAAAAPAVAAPPAAVPAGAAPVAVPGQQAQAVALPAAEAVAGTQASAGREERHAVLVGYGVKLGRTTRRARKGPGASAPAAVAPGVSAQHAAAVPAAAVPAAAVPAAAVPAAAVPAAAAAAEAAPQPANGAPGTPGSITREDVQQAASAPANGAPAAAPAVTAVAREERVAIRGVRKHTAAAVTASAFTAPHVTEFLQLDVTGATEALARIRELPEFAGLRVSPLLLGARALIVPIGRHPMITSSWDEEAHEIVVHHYVNLGIAAATDRGLVVPNIKDAQAMPLPELARALGQLAETARAGKTSPADLAHGTITITNVGVFGVDTGPPILTPGEAAILALGQIKDAPWVHEGQLAVRKVTTLALSFDHRIVDGDLGSIVLSEVGAMLADPLRMLAWS